MSAENRERVERLTREWQAGNWRAGAELVSPDLVLNSRVPEGLVVSEGQEAIARFLRDFLSQWERYWVEPVEFIESGDQVLVIGRQRGVGATSGVEIEEPWYAAFTFRKGSVIDILFTPERVEALKAMGLI